MSDSRGAGIRSKAAALEVHGGGGLQGTPSTTAMHCFSDSALISFTFGSAKDFLSYPSIAPMVVPCH